MDCPGCQAELRRRRIKNGVVIDSCPDCKGTWLDRGELLRFTTNGRNAQENADDLSWNSEHSSRDCCGCGSQMVVGKFAESDIELDYCPSCEGLWFDSRELKKTLRYLESFQPRQMERKTPKSVPKKPQGFWPSLAHSIAIARSPAYRAVYNTEIMEAVNLKTGYAGVRGRVTLRKANLTSPVTQTRCACYREIRDVTRFISISDGHQEGSEGHRGEEGYHGEGRSQSIRNVVSDLWRRSTCFIECEFAGIEVPLQEAVLLVPAEKNKHVERKGGDRYARYATIEEVYLRDGEEIIVYGLVDDGGRRLVAGGNHQPLIVIDVKRSRFLEKERERVFSETLAWLLILGGGVVLVLTAIGFALWYLRR